MKPIFVSGLVCLFNYRLAWLFITLSEYFQLGVRFDTLAWNDKIDQPDYIQAIGANRSWYLIILYEFFSSKLVRFGKIWQLAPNKRCNVKFLKKILIDMRYILPIYSGQPVNNNNTFRLVYFTFSFNLILDNSTNSIVFTYFFHTSFVLGLFSKKIEFKTFIYSYIRRSVPIIQLIVASGWKQMKKLKNYEKLRYFLLFLNVISHFLNLLIRVSFFSSFANVLTILIWKIQYEW